MAAGCNGGPKPAGLFLFGFIKKREYTTPPTALQKLQNRITENCASMSPNILYNVLREVQARVQMCIVAEHIR